MVIKGDKLISLIFIVLSVLMITEARSFPERASFASGYVIFLAILLMFFSVLVLFSKTVKTDQLIIKKVSKFIFLLGSIFLYITLIPYIGFFTTSFIFMIIIMKYLGMNKIFYLIATPVITLGFIYYIFIKFLAIQIPRGFLF